MTRVVVGATCAPYKADDPRGILSWLSNAEQLVANAGVPVEFFAALEVDARGLEPHTPTTTELAEIGGKWWTFSVDDGADRVDHRNRLARICMGRNLVTQYAHDTGASHILFVDTDVTVPDDAVARLLEVDWPIVGGHVPTYCLDGPRVLQVAGPLSTEHRKDVYHIDTGSKHYWSPTPWFPADADVRVHMNTAGFLMVRRDLFTKLRWRWSIDEGLTDDPCYHADAAALGYPTWVRHDVVGARWPSCIGPLETRGHDLRIVRHAPAAV